ncbi:MAG: hypothetical protein AVDCRST_MAG33-403 [uncultured Thermomicrobiales bacterium]|uniref:Luciferase-like domain-containing protein n=1 Tax=uncultured Thermomicrobiales bacterium TaxID=1645740 RepID=A0A6J4UDK0_9BACT|nr:MAG: hypothetical protein AVDCRST_MAG33-403 [uncultured Thermomicrobiales bacterium]
MSRQVSIALQGDKPLARYGELAALAEGYGFDGVSVYADLGFQPAIGPLIEVARATSRVRVGPAALNPYLLHPVEIAGQIAQLDAVSNGRAYLGIARGAWLDTLGVTDDRHLTRLREAVAVVRHLLSGQEDGYTGEVYRLPVGRLFRYPVLRPAVPILIGAWGPKMLAVAGEIADEVKVGGSTNPDLVGEIRRRLAVGEERAGRLPGSVAVCFGAVTVVDEDGQRARAYVRREAARYLPVVAPMDPTVAIPEATLMEIQRLVDADRLDDAAMLVPDDLLDRFAFAGTPEQVVTQAERLFTAGVDRIEFGTPHGLTEDGGLRLLGERVLPALRR